MMIAPFAVLLLVAASANSLASFQNSFTDVSLISPGNEEARVLPTFQEEFRGPPALNEFQLSGSRLRGSKARGSAALDSELSENVGWIRIPRSLSTLGTTLMGVSKIADNPPGAKEQREFEMRQQQEKEMRERQERERKMKEMQRLRDYEEQQYGRRSDRPEFQRRFERPQARRPWESQMQEQDQYRYRAPLQQSEAGEDEELEPGVQASRSSIEIPQPPRAVYGLELEPERYEPPRQALKSQEYDQLYEPMYAEYMREVGGRQRNKRSFLGGLSMDFTKSMGRSIGGSMSEDQIRKDIGRSRFNPLEDSSQGLTGYHTQLFQPSYGPSEIESAQRGPPYGGDNARSSCPCSVQPSPYQSPDALYESKYPEYMGVQKQLSEPSARMTDSLKPMSKKFSQSPVSGYESGVPSYLDTLPSDVNPSIFSKEAYMPSDQMSSSPYQASMSKIYQPEFAQDIPKSIAPATSSMDDQKQPFGPSDPFNQEFNYQPGFAQEASKKIVSAASPMESQKQPFVSNDNFDREFNFMPTLQQTCFDKPMQTSMGPSPALEASLAEPQKSLGRKDQLSGTPQQLQQMDGSWSH